MSGLTFRLNTYPDERLDLSPLIPSRLATLPLADILDLVVGTTKRQLKVGDFFAVSGQSGDTVTIQGGSEHLDFVGAGLDRGTLILDGDAGAYAGRKMTGGELHIRGRAGAWLGSGLSGGLITVKGSAGDQVGSMCPGDKFGMTGGIVHVEGSIGDRVGEKMRRGTIIARGTAGTHAGSRMLGGTIWAEQGFGPGPGTLLRRGTLIGPTVEQMLPTFADSGKHDLVILRVLSRYLSATLGPLAPSPLSGRAHKFAGDLAAIGKGEILIVS